ncbi:tyrosine-protein phosphatase [Tsukamurella sp. 8F]|uniref:tyrosine-protein phosphatase n=1 Tax=unclassified Tsukamurella TaxID=2633480 RepID=UPI0023B98316|nr:MULTISPECIES: tyrosine-protein phosphatase [unclassified Tsukamurella]MDF0529513.1 tyrosine-protein phosphatase [Tsukamurella sp. 8J]MDF0585799.1 tyrosine-protein phosphatase [Tsukamurella sp. 8F]
MTADPTNDALRISGAFNFRDLGGIATPHGVVRSGALFRSAHLGEIDDRGRRTLVELGVTDVFDLRGPIEQEAYGADELPGDVRYHATPFDPARGRAPSPRRLTDPVGYLTDVYRTYPELPGAGAALAAVAGVLAEGGSVLVHCTAGKDRTGWLIATLLRMFGASEEVVSSDYLRSNEAIGPLRDMVVRRRADAEQLSRDFLGVRAEYLAAATEAMTARFGDVAGYLSAVGVSPDTIAALQDRMIGSAP